MKNKTNKDFCLIEIYKFAENCILDSIIKKKLFLVKIKGFVKIKCRLPIPQIYGPSL